MREPNENAIQIARAKARESVQALESLLEWISAIRIPVDACFDLIDSERQLVNCDWSRQESYPVIECRARVKFFFHQRSCVCWIFSDCLRPWNVSFLRTKLSRCSYNVSHCG